MSIEELLRSLIDRLDKIENGGAPQPVVVHVRNNMNGQTSTDVSSSEEDETGPFSPPLQQKIELLKKSAGLKSVFDLADDDGPFES